MSYIPYENIINNNAGQGIIDFDGITINADPTKFDLGRIAARFIDNITNPENPTAKIIILPASTANTVTNLATAAGSFIGVNSSGAIIQQTTPFTNAQLRTIIPLAGIGHPTLTAIASVNSQPMIAYDISLQFYDLMKNLGQFNISGNVFSANGVNLSVNKSIGTICRVGDNYENNTSDPHTVVNGALTAMTFQYRNSTATYAPGNTTLIDPNTFESPLGTNDAVSNNKFTIQRIWMAPPGDIIRIQYGQVEYSSLSDALQNLNSEIYVNNGALASRALLRGFLIVKKGTIDLSNSLEAKFVEAPRFPGASFVGGTSVSTLQQVYVNSTSPEITTDSTHGAITIKRGSAADTDNVLEFQNGAGIQTGFIRGDGTADFTNITSGTYTPTLFNVANLDSSTAFECQYQRNGNTVSVSGKVSVDPTATLTSTKLGISLPIASNLGAEEDCAGTAFTPNISGQGGAILGDATNNRAQLEFIASDINARSLFFTFMYSIIP